jgi:streptogramin lyase
VLSIHCSVRSILPSTISSRISNRRSQLGQMTKLCGVLVALTCSIGTVAAAQTAHFTGVQSIVGSSSQYQPGGVAVDASGNVYISDQDHYAVYKETPAANGLYVQSTVASGLNYVTGLAVDGSGNVYIIEYVSGSVLKETPSSSGYTQSTVASNLNYPSGVAVDGSGYVYIADTSNGRVLLETPSSAGYTQSVVVSGSIYPRGIAVDGNENVYFVDGISSAVLKETPSNGSFIQSQLFAVPIYGGEGQLAIDSSGNLYFTEPISPNGHVFKETLSGGSYTVSTIGNDLDFPSAVAVDGSGNIYIADSFNERVLKETPSGGNFGANPRHSWAGLCRCGHGKLHHEWNNIPVQRRRHMHRGCCLHTDDSRNSERFRGACEYLGGRNCLGFRAGRGAGQWSKSRLRNHVAR